MNSVSVNILAHSRKINSLIKYRENDEMKTKKHARTSKLINSNQSKYVDFFISFLYEAPRMEERKAINGQGKREIKSSFSNEKLKDCKLQDSGSQGGKTFRILYVLGTDEAESNLR